MAGFLILRPVEVTYCRGEGEALTGGKTEVPLEAVHIALIILLLRLSAPFERRWIDQSVCLLATID